VNNRDRTSVAAFDQFDAAEQRRRVSKARDLGQKATDFDLGIDAGYEFSIDLEPHSRIHQRRAVGLFGLHGADMLGRLDRRIRKLAGWPEFKAQARFFNRQGLAEIAQQQRDENLVGGNVQQLSFPRALTYRRKCPGVIAFAIEQRPTSVLRIGDNAAALSDARARSRRALCMPIADRREVPVRSRTL